jgi:hypothetical protein
MEKENLQAHFSGLLRWERRKRREGNLTAALFYALLAAICAQPFLILVRNWVWAVPLAFFCVLAPYFLF